MRKAAWLLLASVAAVGILFLFVFPTRTLLEQDRQIAATQRQIAALQQENAALRTKAAALEDPAQVEQIARALYGLVLPGQKAYAVQQTPTTTPDPPTAGDRGSAATRPPHRP